MLNFELCCEVYKIHHSEEDFENGNIIERIMKFSEYKIKTISLDKIEIGRYSINSDLVEDFCEYPIETMPPIILGKMIKGKFEVVDGEHRLAVCLEKQLTKIKAYVPII